MGSDIALLRVANPTGKTPALVSAGDILATAKIGDEVVVAIRQSAPRRGSVATQTSGRVNGASVRPGWRVDAESFSPATAAAPSSI